MKTDNEKIKELIQLSQENPELPIIMATWNEVVGEDFGYWVGDIEKIHKGYFYDMDEGWKAGNKADICEEIADEYLSDTKYDVMPSEEYNICLESQFNTLLESNKIREAIVVYIGLP